MKVHNFQYEAVVARTLWNG